MCLLKSQNINLNPSLIKNKYNARKGKGTMSQLESCCKRLLEEANIPFEYEGIEYELVPKVTYSSFEKSRKNFKEIKTTRAVIYRPDFICPNRTWIIETKGFKTPDFVIKWKLLKQRLYNENKNIVLFMPTNKKQIECSIELIKRMQSQ